MFLKRQKVLKLWEINQQQKKSNADDSVLYSVSEGTAILLSQVNDATFASEVLGKGIAVIPSKGEVVAPCDAVVETVLIQSMQLV